MQYFFLILIKKRAFSGGQDTIEKHRQFGANIDIDVSCRYLSIFSKISDIDVSVDLVLNNYKQGNILTGELKRIVIDILCNIITKFRDNRPTNDAINNIMTVRQLASFILHLH
jgi:tryptophanyl-tRNA synthetase